MTFLHEGWFVRPNVKGAEAKSFFVSYGRVILKLQMFKARQKLN